jgi:hypothetical protein
VTKWSVNAKVDDVVVDRKTNTSNRFRSSLMSRRRVASVEIEARMSDRMRAVSRRASRSSFLVGA